MFSQTSIKVKLYVFKQRTSYFKAKDSFGAGNEKGDPDDEFYAKASKSKKDPFDQVSEITFLPFYNLKQ